MSKNNKVEDIENKIEKLEEEVKELKEKDKIIIKEIEEINDKWYYSWQEFIRDFWYLSKFKFEDIKIYELREKVKHTIIKEICQDTNTLNIDKKDKEKTIEEILKELDLCRSNTIHLVYLFLKEQLIEDKKLIKYKKDK